MFPLPAPWALRDARETDQRFLDDLYFSCREDLHAVVPDPTLLRQLVTMQQSAQQTALRRDFPGATHLIVQAGAKPVGRVVIDRSVADLRLVDIAIAPQARRNGAATAVLQALQAHALAAGVPVSLAVARSNSAARSLYLRHGFTVQSHDDLFEQMVWRGAAA